MWGDGVSVVKWSEGSDGDMMPTRSGRKINLNQIGSSMDKTELTLTTINLLHAIFFSTSSITALRIIGTDQHSYEYTISSYSTSTNESVDAANFH